MNAKRSLLAAAMALVFTAASAHALVLTEKTDPQKHRKDISKQLGKYIFCVANAALKCEKKGAHSGVECHTDTGAVDFPDPKTAAKFTADLAKCDAKFVPEKKAKTSDYDQIGCPGDCDLAAPGTQRCTDLAEYETAVVESPSNPNGVKTQVPILGALIDVNCGGPASTDKGVNKCVKNDAKKLAVWVKKLELCYEKCEDDYKNKKGNGGPDNDTMRCSYASTTDPNARKCFDTADKQLGKVVPANAGLATTVIAPLLDSVKDDFFNKDDAAAPGSTTDDGAAVCSVCGDGVREGIEECDGGDDAACPAACKPDCTCP